MPGTSFERAAGFYDATRSLPPDVRESLADLLALELARRRPCLEIGVGTGRIALPLHARGVQLMGVDLSLGMLKKLVVNAGQGRPFPILAADACALPFDDRSFGAVFVSHVFHLLSDWQRAVEEGLRVLCKAGTLLIDFGGHPRAPWSDATIELLRARGIARRRPGVTSPSEMAEYLGSRATPRRLPPIPLRVERTLQEDLDDWESQIFAWTWPYSKAQLRAACADVRSWPNDHGWPLDKKVRIERPIQWWAYDLTG